MSSPCLKDKIALITGASRGIGAAVAKRFAKEGAHVILCARTVGGLEEVDDAIQAGGGKATLVPIDLREGDTIDQLGAQLFKRYGKLDILVGNAGVLGDLTPLTHAGVKMFERVLAVNLTANWRLIRSFDPLLRASAAGRAMFVTSAAALRHTPFWGPYAVSKAALEAMIMTYAEEMKTTPVTVNLIDPGVVRTRLRAGAMPGEDPNCLPGPEAITERFVELARVENTRHGERVKAQ